MEESAVVRSVGTPRKWFGPPFWVCFLVLSLTYQIPLLLGTVAVLVLSGSASDTGWYGCYLLFAGAIGLYAVLSAYRQMKTTGPVVGARGIACEGTWGGRQAVLWDDVVGAELTYVFGLAYLRVCVRGVSRPLWVPLQLGNPEGFAAAVGEYAGEDHPLTRAVSAWLYRE